MIIEDPNNEFAYVLQWLEESRIALQPRLQKCRENLDAYHHKPQHNYYKERAKAFDGKKAMSQGHIPLETIEAIDNIAKTIPEGRSDVIYKAVETNVNQLSGGIGQFQMTLLDKASVLEDDLELKLSLGAERIYSIYGIDRLRDTAVRELQLYGATYFYPYYNEEVKDIVIETIPINKMILDPIRFKRNGARYIGFRKMISWKDLEKEITFKNGFMKTVNEAKVEAHNIKDIMANPNMQHMGYDDADIKGRLFSIYTDKKYQSNATTIEGKAKQSYQGEDVEISYIWDLTTGEKFSIVNRKYIIDKTEKDLEVITHIENELTFETIRTKLLKRIQSPIIEIPFKIVPSEPYPITPLDMYGYVFDEICSLESLKRHNESLVGTITPFGSDYDLALLSNVPPISGVALTGADGLVGYVRKDYDPSFIDSRISQKEQKIIQAMNAYSQIDMSMMIGDRATAKEVSQNSTAVASGHNALIHNIENGFAEILRVVFLLIVKYRSDKRIKVRIGEELDTLAIESLALDGVLNVRLKSEVERSRQQASLVASQLINLGVSNQYINQEKFVPKMLEIAFGNLFSKHELQEIIQVPVDKEQLALAKQNAENRANELLLEQQIVDEQPEAKIARLMQAQMTPEDKELFAQEVAQGGLTNANFEQMLDSGEQQQQLQAQDIAEENGAISANDTVAQNTPPTEDNNGELQPSSKGLPPEMAGLIANGSEV